MYSCSGEVEVDARLVMTTDPKPRLRWTAELHDRFVDAVTQLGGPASEFFFFFPSEFILLIFESTHLVICDYFEDCCVVPLTCLLVWLCE